MSRDDDETPPDTGPDARTAAPDACPVRPVAGGGRASLVVVDGGQIALAESVRCADCDRFRPGRMPLLGCCAAGQPEPPAGLWAQDRRGCPLYLHADLADAIRAMGARWHYLPDELAWALEQATQAPASWWMLIEADLCMRRWPGAEAEAEREAAGQQVHERTG